MDSRSTSGSIATSPKGAGVFARRVQRQLSRAQEKVGFKYATLRVSATLFFM